MERAVTVILWALLNFLDYRMNTTKGHDSGGEYLFEDTEWKYRSKGKSGSETDQLEKALQNDCMRSLGVFMGRQARLEPSDIGGGRADISVEYQRQRIVIEVKREDRNASHEALRKARGAQTVEYGTANTRIGFLLVLDRSQPDGRPTSIDQNVSIQKLTKTNETEPRTFIIVVMPGKRKVPSAMGPVADAEFTLLPDQDVEPSG
ncbi:hypothetical protein GBZ26_11380 [Azospirillum formosense]|uniref:Uncharacterized protein n=1 Tax=Azospirillum formosense TaxID=861533 RepID=A0ABX2L1Z4_9PROT|nr:hypothetical protein [Azospirillum formosense]NUB19813.1 hypothetical protein [Azospirillum formosense]